MANQKPKIVLPGWVRHVVVLVITLLCCFGVLRINPTWTGVVYALCVAIGGYICWFFWGQWMNMVLYTGVFLVISIVGFWAINRYLFGNPANSKTEKVITAKEPLSESDSLSLMKNNLAVANDNVSNLNDLVKAKSDTIKSLREELASQKSSTPDSTKNDTVAHSNEIAYLRKGLDSVKKVLAVKQLPKKGQSKKRPCPGRVQAKAYVSPYAQL